MPSRPVVLAAVLAALAACTSAPPLPERSTGARPAEISPVAAGLKSVKDYAQEFCNGATMAPDCPDGAVPDLLRRPLQIPKIEPGVPCPVSRANPRIWGRFAPGLGPGPVAPVLLGYHATLRYQPRFQGSDWGAAKVLWVSAPDYDGPILIRGGRVDGDDGVGFSLGRRLLAELQLPPGPSLNVNGQGWRNWPSLTRIHAPGCYAYQVDGTDFSLVLVFQAMPVG